MPCPLSGKIGRPPGAAADRGLDPHRAESATRSTRPGRRVDLGTPRPAGRRRTSVSAGPADATGHSSAPNAATDRRSEPDRRIRHTPAQAATPPRTPHGAPVPGAPPRGPASASRPPPRLARRRHELAEGGRHPATRSRSRPRSSSPGCPHHAARARPQGDEHTVPRGGAWTDAGRPRAASPRPSGHAAAPASGAGRSPRPDTARDVEPGAAQPAGTAGRPTRRPAAPPQPPAGPRPPPLAPPPPVAPPPRRGRAVARPAPAVAPPPAGCRPRLDVAGPGSRRRRRWPWVTAALIAAHRRLLLRLPGPTPALLGPVSGAAGGSAARAGRRTSGLRRRAGAPAARRGPQGETLGATCSPTTTFAAVYRDGARQAGHGLRRHRPAADPTVRPGGRDRASSPSSTRSPTSVTSTPGCGVSTSGAQSAGTEGESVVVCTSADHGSLDHRRRSLALRRRERGTAGTLRAESSSGADRPGGRAAPHNGAGRWRRRHRGSGRAAPARVRASPGADRPGRARRGVPGHVLLAGQLLDLRHDLVGDLRAATCGRRPAGEVERLAEPDRDLAAPSPASGRRSAAPCPCRCMPTGMIGTPAASASRADPGAPAVEPAVRRAGALRVDADQVTGLERRDRRVERGQRGPAAGRARPGSRRGRSSASW